MPLKKTVASIVVAMFLLFGLSGCWDYREPDEVAWILALGIDKGRQNNLTITAVVAVPKAIGAGGEGGGGGDKPFIVASVEAETLLGGLELFNTFIDRRTDLSHTTWIVFGRSLAEEGISQYFSPLTRFREFRRTTTVLVAQGRAEDLLKQGEPDLEDNVAKYYELLSRGWRYTEYIPRNGFADFYLVSKTPGSGAITLLAAIQDKEKQELFPDARPKDEGVYYAGRIPREGASKLEVMGSAVFKGGKMVGILDGAETGSLKMVRGSFRETIVDLRDPEHPDQYIIIRARARENPVIKVDTSPQVPSITMHLPFEGDIISIQSGEHYELPERLHTIEQTVENDFARDIRAVLEKSQNWGVDVFQLEDEAKKNFLTWPEWIEYHWEDKYPGATLDINVDFQIRRTGLLHETVPVHE